MLGDIIEHVDNAGVALDAAASMLEPGGTVVVTCPNAFGLPNFIRFLLGRFHEGDDHVASYNKWTLAHLLQRHGFAIDSVWTALDRPPRTRLKASVYKLLAGLLRAAPELGGTLVMTARRTEPRASDRLRGRPVALLPLAGPVVRIGLELFGNYVDLRRERSKMRIGLSTRRTNCARSDGIIAASWNDRGLRQILGRLSRPAVAELKHTKGVRQAGSPSPRCAAKLTSGRPPRGRVGHRARKPPLLNAAVS